MLLINEIWFGVQTFVATKRRGDTGASLIEYALLVALIAVVCVLAVVYFGGETSTSFSRTANSVANA